MKAIYNTSGGEDGKGRLTIETARTMNIDEMSDFTSFLLTMINAIKVEIKKSVEAETAGAISFDCTEEEAEKISRKMSFNLVKN